MARHKSIRENLRDFFRWSLTRAFDLAYEGEKISCEDCEKLLSQTWDDLVAEKMIILEHQNHD